MIWVFHGDNHLASRNVLQRTLEQLKRQNPDVEVVRLDGTKLTETELIQALEAPTLLAEGRIVVIERLLTRQRSQQKEKLITRIVESFNLYPSNLNLILWEPKSVTAASLKKLKTSKDCRVQEFKLSKSLFRFLDALRPGNGQQLVKLLRQTLTTDPPELIMFMLVRRVTELILAAEGRSNLRRSNLPRLDLLGGVRFDWQKGKLRRQAETWTVDQLVKSHRKLTEIDEAVKTGASPSDSATHLDILFLSL